MSPTTAQLGAESVPVKYLDQKHPTWRLYKDEWDTLGVMYEGGIKLKNYGSNLLLKRPKELFDTFQERFRRLTYEDILANCVRWYIAKLFATEAKIDGKTEDDRFAAFLQDCDRAGTTFAQFSRNLFECMVLYQAAFVLIDKPQPDADKPVQTRADEQTQGLDRPYLVMYQPQQAINWQVDDYGNLNWVIFKTYSERQEGPLTPCKRSVNWYIFDKQNYTHYRFDKKESNSSATLAVDDPEKWAGEADQATLVAGPMPHALSKQERVPVRVCSLPSSLWFTNACYLQLCEHIDFLNAYAWKLFISCYPQLVIYSDIDVQGQTLSEVAFLKFAKGDKVEYLEPDGKSFTECANYLERLRMEIYRSFHLQAQAKTSTATADGASGYSKEQDMAPAIDILNALGDQMRADQQLILLDYKEAAGLPVNGDTDKPDVDGYKFETKPALQEIEVAQSVIDLGLTDKSPTLETVLDQNVALALLDGQNEETKEKVMSEIEKAPTRKETKDAEEQVQQDAFAQRFQRGVATGVLADEKDAVAA